MKRMLQYFDLPGYADAGDTKKPREHYLYRLQNILRNTRMHEKIL